MRENIGKRFLSMSITREFLVTKEKVILSGERVIFTSITPLHPIHPHSLVILNLNKVLNDDDIVFIEKEALNKFLALVISLFLHIFNLSKYHNLGSNFEQRCKIETLKILPRMNLTNTSLGQ